MYPMVDSASFVWRNLATGKVLDSNHDGGVYASERNGGDFQSWEVHTLPDKYWQLVDKATGRVLDGKNSGSTYTEGWNGGDYQKWSLVPDESTNSYKIVQKATGHVLDSNGAGNVYLNGDNGGRYQRWVPAFSSVVVTSANLDVKYNQIDAPTPAPQVMSAMVVKNSSKTSAVQRTVGLSCTRASTFEFGFTETVGASVTVGGKVGIPLVAEGTAEATVSIEVGANQSWSTTTTVGYEASDVVTVPPLSAVQVTGYLYWSDDLEVPFTATAVLRGKSGSLDLPADALIAFLRGDGCDAVLDKIDGTGVKATFHGILTGGWGVRSELQLQDVDLTRARDAEDLSALAGA